MRILIIEDEAELAQNLAFGLQRLGYAVDLAFDGLSGEAKAFINEYDLIILDLNLPFKDGLSVCKDLRHDGNKSAILMLTARGRISDKISGLDSGADDYLSKPFVFDELRARIQALLRRSQGRGTPSVNIGGLCVDPSSRTAAYKGYEIALTGKEFDILEFLATRYPCVVSVEEILEHVWNEDANQFTNTVRVHLANLRRKVNEASDKPVIETLIGKGYRLCLKN